MIKILADSLHDRMFVAAAVGGATSPFDDAAHFANGDGHVECLILGCRHPIPPERVELVRKIKRDTPASRHRRTRGLRPIRMGPLGGVLMIVLLTAAAVTEVGAQAGRDTLVHVSSLAVPDSVPLTYIEHLVLRADGSVFLIDARTDGILMFAADGTFRRRIGARGEGPGELLSPWRLGLLGQDTLWVVDAGRPRVNLYDAATGVSLTDIGSATWGAAAAEGNQLQPFAVLADRRVAALRWTHEETVLEVLAYDAIGHQASLEATTVAVLDVAGRSLSVAVPAGGGGLQLRNPFSHNDMFSIDPSGRTFAVVRRPTPSRSGAFFVLERHSVLEGSMDSTNIPYAPRPLETNEIREWAADLGAVKRMVELGVFPSREAGIRAVLDALDQPDYYPPVRNRGRGIVEHGVLIDSGGAMWFDVSDTSGRNNDWLVISDKNDVSRLSLPDDARLLAVRGNLVWVELRDNFGVPAVRMFRVQGSGR